MPLAAQPAASVKLADIPLWPEKALAEDRIAPPRQPQMALPARLHRYTQVDRPVIMPYRPANPNGSAIISCAGGGYVVVGQSPVQPHWFAQRGFWVFDLLYRLPGGGWRAGPDASLQDVQQAIRMVRSRAAEFGIDPQRIGVAGFSAGGHIAASAATRFDDALAPPSTALAATSARPAFALLACPVITMSEPHRHGASMLALFGGKPSPEQAERCSPDRHVTASSSPCFLAHAADDRVVPPQNSIGMFTALRAAGVSAELHVFSAGGHDMGKGFVPGSPVSAYPDLFVEWLAREQPIAASANRKKGEG